MEMQTTIVCLKLHFACFRSTMFGLKKEVRRAGKKRNKLKPALAGHKEET